MPSNARIEAGGLANVAFIVNAAEDVDPVHDDNDAIVDARFQNGKSRVGDAACTLFRLGRCAPSLRAFSLSNGLL